MDQPAIKPRTAKELGIMRGFPPPPEKRPDLTNWDLAPFNRWSFLNIRNLFPTADVKADPGNLQIIKPAFRDLSKLSFPDFNGNTKTISQFIDDTYTDGFAVLHEGKVITENYFNDMKPNSSHLSQSVAKSVVGTLVGILKEQGVMDPDAPIVSYVPELAQCGYKDAKLSHALNMTSGVRFVEDYNMPESDMTRIDVASGWRPVPDGKERHTIREVILTLPKIRPHGAIFDYRSIETDVVAWAIERACNKPLSELVSELIWQKIGAQHDGFFTIDGAGTALADGGFNASLMDYARFGLMMQNGGKVGKEQIVPASWVDLCSKGDASIYGAPYTNTSPNGSYSNFWWVDNIEAGDFMARGVFGQMIYINPKAKLTIVKLSTWPDYQITNFTKDSLGAFKAIKDYLCI